MKVRLKALWRLVSFVILITLAGQGLWIYSMIEAYKKEFNGFINSALENAAFMDINSRNEQLGGLVAFSPQGFKDTSRYVRKKITTVDTVFWVDIDRYDKFSDLKVGQYIIKDLLPLSVMKLDSLFRVELASRKPMVFNTYVEYLDLKTGTVLETDKKSGMGNGFMPTDLISIDIKNSQGVRAYVEMNRKMIFEGIAYQLLLSAVLILIVSFFLFFLIYVIFKQKKADEMRQRSVDSMTHEFKRPISAAVARAALIPFYLDRADLGKVKAYSESILLEMNKLSAYTERIQKISRDEKEMFSLNKSAVDIKFFFEDLKKRYTGKEDPDVNIELVVETRREQMRVDPPHFSNVMDNLVENAIKYRKENEPVHICIRVAERKENLLISVKDNGIGMSHVDKIHIFNKYYRSKDKAVQRTPGFGLGLTYVQSIVEAQGGTIGVESKPGEGSDFMMEIPVD